MKAKESSHESSSNQGFIGSMLIPGGPPIQAYVFLVAISIRKRKLKVFGRLSILLIGQWMPPGTGKNA